eukprot:387228-Rhodomonas_salina.6
MTGARPSDLQALLDLELLSACDHLLCTRRAPLSGFPSHSLSILFFLSSLPPRPKRLTPSSSVAFRMAY